jgi:DNA-directed RNA polymerase I subunit RPA43
VGDVVEGLIYMQSPSHIGLLIHDTFNASIKKFNIPDDWSFIPNQADENDEEAAEAAEADAVSSRGRNNILGQWVDANQVPIDGKLKVTVKAVHTGSKVVSLEGTLIRPEEEISSFPVVPGGKKTKFDDDDVVPEVTKVLDDPTTVPGYESGSDGDVVAQDDSSEDDDDDSDSD